MNKQIFSVSQVNYYVKGLMDRDPLLRNLSIRGEISNFKLHSSGHMYFTLKDDRGRIRCVFFKSYGSRLNFLPEDGMAVIVKGNISLYLQDGQYQFYVEAMERDGLGDLHKAYELLKAKLQKEGLFRQEYKQEIPASPQKIAIITSHTGAAVHDVIKVISRRNPLVDILVIPVAVQGDLAKDQIRGAIAYANTRNDIDLIILGRGGGSIEELWPFNEEMVARAIFQSKIPIISAVGHETDFTISDMVADARAATPSVAGEMAVMEVSQILSGIESLKTRAVVSMNGHLQRHENRFRRVRDNYLFRYPHRFFSMEKQNLDYIIDRLNKASGNGLAQKGQRFNGLASKLEALNPLSIMMRGFSIVTDAQTQETINSIEQLQLGMDISLHLTDGRAGCRIIEKEGGPDEDG